MADFVIGDFHHLDAFAQQHAVELAQGGHVAGDFQSVVLQPQPALMGAGFGTNQRNVVVLGAKRHHHPALATGTFVHTQDVGVPKC